MKIFKLLTNDYVLFLITLILMSFVYLNIQYQFFNIFIEILFIGILYYLISLLVSSIVVVLLYLNVKSVFNNKTRYNILKKIEIVSSIFSEYFDEINSSKDFERKLKEVYN